MTEPLPQPARDRPQPGLRGWLHTRLDFDPLLALLRRKPVPVHRHSWVYMLADSAVFLFAIQAVTGCMLMLYYQPAEATAHESVGKIMTEVPYGWFVRSMHAWGASLFILVAALHLVTEFWMRAYRVPRELTWMSGVLMLFVVMVSGFSGYLLPWNELSYYATRVGTQIPGKLPLVGPWLVRFVRGGEQLTGETITRFFAAHVMLAPLTMLLLLGLHVFFSRVRGVSLPLGMSRRDVKDRRPFYSEFLLLDLGVWLVLVGLLATVSVLWPAGTGVKADPLIPAPEGIKPEWYFLFLFQTLKVLPETLGLLLFAAAALFLLGVPLLDRGARFGRPSRVVTAIFAILLAYAAVFEVLAIIAPGVAGTAKPLVAETYRPAANLVSLGLAWPVIGVLWFYLRRLADENARVRRFYRKQDSAIMSAARDERL